ncbi:MAG: hypothetical protein DME22_21625 [Verrucomicrobia bacterium]|nr:MAG: hypothetical protein DME22_21625 [Verrucomicrobiota bacterium]
MRPPRRRRQFTGRNAVGPVGEHFQRALLADLDERRDHVSPSLFGLQATFPGLLPRIKIPQAFG